MSHSYYHVLAAVLGSPTNRNSSAMTFEFTKPKEDRSAAFLHELRISRAIQNANPKTFNCGPSTCTATGLAANTEYIARIVACAKYPPLCSQASNEIRAFTKPDRKSTLLIFGTEKKLLNRQCHYPKTTTEHHSSTTDWKSVNQRAITLTDLSPIAFKYNPLCRFCGQRDMR